MQSLHEMLKRQPGDKGRQHASQDELRGRYSKIGISAVAAATQFNGTQETEAARPHGATADGSTSRGWSRHR